MSQGLQYLICYDVSDDGRRSRLAELLKDFGQRIQHSVFVAHLDDELAGQMREKASRLIDTQLDALHIFALCRSCGAKTEAMGVAQIPEDKDYYVL